MIGSESSTNEAIYDLVLLQVDLDEILQPPDLLEEQLHLGVLHVQGFEVRGVLQLAAELVDVLREEEHRPLVQPRAGGNVLMWRP